jgi:hypothetical protein
VHRQRTHRELDRRGRRKRDEPQRCALVQSRSQFRVARTPLREDDTTLPRMAGDTGLLTSTTTSESEIWPVTYAYEPLTATLAACVYSK